LKAFGARGRKSVAQKERCDGAFTPASIRKALALGILLLGVLFVSALFDPLAGRLDLRGGPETVARLFSFLGNGGFLIPLSLAVYLLGRFLRKDPLILAGRESLYAVLLSGGLVQVLKAVFERPRPSHTEGFVLHAITHPSFFDLTGKFNSFPSGHTTTAFALAAALGARFPRLRLPLLAFAGLVALSRIGLGSHYPSDIAGGAVLGLGVGWLLANRSPWARNRKKWVLAGLAVLVVSVCFFKLGGYLVFDVDEAVFSEASREMVVTGDYITPTYNFEPRYDKPILFYWAMSGAFRLMGITEFAARFPSAGFGVLLVLTTFLFALRFSNFSGALWSALVVLLNLEFLVYSHSAVTDMTLAFFISGALFSVFTAIKTGKKGLYIAFWVSSALAMLTKGIIGILFPLSITLIYLALRRELRAIKKLLNPLHILIFLILAMPWFVLEYHERGWEWIEAFIIKHHFHRFTGVISSHGGPFYFYVLILLAGFFPWVALLPGALAEGIKNMRDRIEDNDVLSFTTIWFFFIFIFFSISRTKLPNYIFPAIPACSILVGITVSRIINQAKPGKTGLAFMGALAIVLSVAAFATPHLRVDMDIPLPTGLFNALGVVFLLTGLFSLSSMRRPGKYLPLVAASTVALIVVLRLQAIPTVNAFMQKDLHDYALYAKKTLPETRLATFEINQPSIAFYYADGKILKLEGNSLKNALTNTRKRLLIITKASITRTLEEKYGLKTLRKGANFALMSTGEK